MASKLIYETQSDQLYKNHSEAVSFLTILSTIIKKETVSNKDGSETYEYKGCSLKVDYLGEKNLIKATGSEENIKGLEDMVKRLKSLEVFTD